MPLAAGTRLGAYEIAGALGSGGMGDVYRARDTRLNRVVAIKVLSDLFAGDRDRLARFEREAQLLAALNHARIATIYGLEETNGVRALAMELVEGPTLAERLTAGPIGASEALELARNLAEGLEYAHERGIIHRDLKPSNIKITPDGSIKILDFGLAKALDTKASGTNLANSPTISVAGTQAGVLLGTAAYMSPEQARGLPVDRRADIWAFGCVVYEMLTGQQPFPGATLTDVLAAIVTREPDWDRLPAGLPPRVDSLLRRCLRKDPRDRLRDIGDARLEIEEIQLAPPNTAEAPSVARRTSPWMLLTAALAGLVVGALIIWALLGPRRSLAPAAKGLTRLQAELPAKTTLSLGRGSAVAVSPDGSTVVFVATAGGQPQLFARALDRFESALLPGTDGATNPFFSPDGKWVGFFAGGRLKKVALSGGQPVTVCDAPNARGESWSADDFIYFTPTSGSAVWRVSAMGGTPAEITKRQQGELSHRWPHILPDGKTILFAVWNDTGFEGAQIVAQSLATGERRTLLTGGSYPRYLPSADGTNAGYLVYARASGLLAAPFDTGRLQLTASPVPILDGVVTNLSGGAHFAFSTSGSLTYIAGGLAEAARVIALVDRNGTARTLMTIPGMSLYYQVSPDGKRLVRSNPAGPDRDIWIHDLQRGTATRLTYGDNSSRPIWTADGKRIAFSAGLPDPNIFWKAADGTGSMERLTTSPNTQFAGAFAPDGKLLVYVENNPASGSDIWILPLEGDRTPRPFLKTPFVEGEVALSPDGHWLAYQSNESGRFEIYLQPFPSGGRRFQISTDGGGTAQWSRNGREIFYRNQNRMMAVAVRPGASAAPSTLELEVEKPRVLFEGGYETVFSLTPDDRFVLIRNVMEEFTPTAVHVVLGWVDELRRAVK
jgi:Tol biopolymer transport system component